MIGCNIYEPENEYEVIDQAKIKGVMYLLVKGRNNSYAIYKIISVGKEVRLSNKKVLQNLKFFSNPTYWKLNTTVQIDADGNIKSVKSGSLFIIKSPTYVYIRVY